MLDIDNGLDFNQQFAEAYDLLENSQRNIFVTGKAGTGKSTLLQYFREHTTKNVVVLAPTGVAAVNVKGQTVHSFFRFKPNITLEKVPTLKIKKADRELYRNMDAVIIDEVSMVRADLLDCVDAFLRLYGRDKKKVFGGVQMIFMGDLYQLPPVVNREEQDIFRGVYASPYFFDSKVFETLELACIDLSKIYRQTDDVFIELLNAIRTKCVAETQMRTLNERYNPYFIPPEDDFYIYLTTTNALADGINENHLQKLETKAYRYVGAVEGKFESKTLPTHKCLDLKVGSQVMLLNNDPQGRWVNGSIGKITDIVEDLSATDLISIELEDGREVEVSPFKWEMFRFCFNKDTETIESEMVGAFSQYPLKLAWAVTIHKSQGKTFSKVVVDIGQGAFSHGQTYVALSRCTTLDGLVLRKPILRKHLILDRRVVDFMSRYQAVVN